MQQVAEEGGFARAGRSADHDEAPERQAQVDGPQIAEAGARQLQPSGLGFGFWVLSFGLARQSCLGPQASF